MKYSSGYFARRRGNAVIWTSISDHRTKVLAIAINVHLSL
jgi:hypothetical protein